MASGQVLEVSCGDESWTLVPGAIATIGRTTDADVVVTHELVSRRHAVVEAEPDGWRVRDSGSRNGIFADGQRVDSLLVAGPQELRLGDPDIGPVLRLRPGAHLAPVPREPPVPAPQPSWGTPSGFAEQAPSAVYRVPEAVVSAAGGASSGAWVPMRRLSVGRALDNDVRVDDLLVSRHHAEVLVTDSGAEVVDLGSDNGTFVNGRRVTRSPLGPEDLLSVGSARFVLRDGLLVEHLDTGRVSFAARGLGVTVRAEGGRSARRGGAGAKVLLDDVSFSLDSSMLLAVVGPSGAGKSTLLGALTGFRPAGRGGVLYDGRDLYANYADLRHRIGFVPQDDVLHPQLTVRRALGYAARLRFGEDTSAAERGARVEEVIAELGLTTQADLRIDKLSGGQRKRTSVALELLTRPSLLFLDEPTSGLDPGLDKQVMGTLRELADGGRTVVVVTHSVANLGVCDRVLLLAPGGRVAYFGPPEGVLEHFGMSDYSDVFLALQRSAGPGGGTDWPARYRASAAHARYIGAVDDPLGPDVLAPAGQQGAAGQGEASGGPGGSYAPPPRRQRAFTQFRILARRYLEVVGADRQYVVFLAALPIALSALARIVPAPYGLGPVPSGERAQNYQSVQVLLVLVISGALMGTATAIREIIKEREVYRRERSVGLSPVAYLASKAGVLGLVVVAQAAVLVALSLVGRALPPHALALGSSWVELAAAVALVAVASMGLGLAISALVTTADQAMPLMVLVVMTQIVFAGALFPVHGREVLEQVSWVSPSRWGFVQLAGTTDVKGLIPDSDLVDRLWADDAASWLRAGGYLVAILVVSLVAAGLRLRRLDPKAR